VEQGKQKMVPHLPMMQQQLDNWSVCSGLLNVVAAQRTEEMDAVQHHFIWVSKHPEYVDTQNT
jgi:hypothetical protein